MISLRSGVKLTLMKKLSLYVFLVLMFSFFTSHSFAENFPKNEPIPDGAMYRGINEEQWKTIKKIGDPLDCQQRLYNFQQIKDYKVIGPEDCKGNMNCIQDALSKNKHVKLKEGNYKIYSSIVVYKKVLTGENGNVIINAEGVGGRAVMVNEGIVANININFAKDIAFDIKFDSLVYRSVARNTGVKSSSTTKGHGFSVVDYGLDRSRTKDDLKNGKGFSFNSCLISLESSYSYNESGGSKYTKKGGNADGFQIKYGAADVTLIDTHAHHNSDDGFDFWKAGKKSEKPVIRIFYSSSNFNGKHPTKPNGDGNGYKLGSANKYQKDRGKDWGARLIYGSVACENKMNGFDKNKSPVKIISLGNQSKKNRKVNFHKVSNKKIKDDKNLLKCSMFKK